MKQLISATLSLEAAEIYNNWEKQKKSQILSEIIIKNNSNHQRVIDLTEGLNDRNIQIARVIWELKGMPNYELLCTDLNDLLIGTIHYQYES